jgi:hypothetical protein
VVVHVVADEESLTDDSAVQLDGESAPGPTAASLPQMTIRDALSPRPEEVTARFAATGPAKVIGGAILPAPLLAATLAQTAKIVPIVFPGDSPPERRYIPSAVLATFVRCRDLTCRFPGCDAPADVCDVDHTIAYPVGPTQAANLKCLCRKHHLLKTFWGWRDHQHPDGTVVWTSPHGQSYTTHPGSRLLFPRLCRPTAAVTAREELRDAPATGATTRGLMMPRRKQTRAQQRANNIEDQRRLNEPWAAERIAERNKPPPF